MSTLPNEVWIFIGLHSTAPNAVFSSLELTKVWLRKNILSGYVYLHKLNEPGFDFHLIRGDLLPRKLRDVVVKNPEVITQLRETWYNRTEVFMVAFGVFELDDDFPDAHDKLVASPPVEFQWK